MMNMKNMRTDSELSACHYDWTLMLLLLLHDVVPFLPTRAD